MTQRAPIIVILGATACGKSRLAVELARKFSGEIISADSMQVYKGLDIVTNKVSEEEQQLAKHHMINFQDPNSRFSVVDFRNKSLDIISDLHRQNKLPIIVGGTNYYIESLIWKSFTFQPTFRQPLKRNHDEDEDQTDYTIAQQTTLIDSEAEFLKLNPEIKKHSEEDLEDLDKFFSKQIYNDGFEHIESVKLWNILEKVDPKMAHIYHPHDKRRIIRILQMIQENNREKTYSDILNEANRSTRDEASLGGPLRFDKTCIIWLQCDNDILDKIMDDRVDDMLNKGLLAELENFHEEYNKQRSKEGKRPDYSKGIFQTIGFKEFHDYLMLSVDVKNSEEGNKIFKQCIFQMKLSTRRYARRQLKWIRRRFLQSGTRDLPPLYKLDTAYDEQGWSKQVHCPAMSLVDKFLKGESMTEELLSYKLEPEKQEIVNKPGKLHCQVCDRVLIGSNCIEIHLKSRAHRKKSLNLQLENKKQKTSDESKPEGESVVVEDNKCSSESAGSGLC